MHHILNKFLNLIIFAMHCNCSLSNHKINHMDGKLTLNSLNNLIQYNIKKLVIYYPYLFAFSKIHLKSYGLRFFKRKRKTQEIKKRLK